MKFGTWKVGIPYSSGSLTAAARELAGWKLNFVGVQEVGKRGTAKTRDYNFFHGKGNENHQLATGIFTPQKSISS